MHLFHVSLALNETKGAELLARVFEDKFDQRNCSEKCAPKTCQSFQTLGQGTCIYFVGRERDEKSRAVGAGFPAHIPSTQLFGKLMVLKHWAMGHA